MHPTNHTIMSLKRGIVSYSLQSLSLGADRWRNTHNTQFCCSLPRRGLELVYLLHFRYPSAQCSPTKIAPKCPARHNTVSLVTPWCDDDRVK